MAPKKGQKRKQNGQTRTPVAKYFKEGVDDASVSAKLAASLAAESVELVSLRQEHCFNVQLADDASALGAEDEARLMWLLAETYEPERTARGTFFPAGGAGAAIEVGPRMSFCTAWSSNAVSICAACGLGGVARIERSRRYLAVTKPQLSEETLRMHADALHDRMTECVYVAPLVSFTAEAAAAGTPVRTVPVLSGGKAALEKVSKEMGLGFDEADLEFYYKLFVEKLGRDPTDVECFDMGQSNSEHSRHWFFGGLIEIDGVPKPSSLFQLVKATLKSPQANENSIIAFHDNSSAIAGPAVTALRPAGVGASSKFVLTADTYHPILTAETHNFPVGVAPFPGAETGTGGRIRDVQATGRGAFVVAGVSAYCFGNLRIPGYVQPWEDDASYADNLAPPLQIQVEASNGASDYGNKFGEPVITGFNRSFGMRLPSGERREWIKPIMFSAGLGAMPASLAKKGAPEEGMWVVKVGGPAYRIGVGGGAASSKADGEGTPGAAALDFNAVQRGDAEMENKMNRVIRACIELGVENPIVSIHDQGAGGNGNVLKEICEPLGAKLQVRDILSGDPTLSVLEIWGAEYQENCALLLRPESLPLFKSICARENCPASFVGQVTGDGRVVLEDRSDGTTPFDLPLSLVLADMPRKTFPSKTADYIASSGLKPLALPAGTTVAAALDRVLRLPSVASKRFLTNKVDRSVTGLIAQQQCVGPYGTPLADVGVVAHTHTGTTGSATAVGEQPIKGLLSPAAMARLSVAESLTNLVWAPITALGDVKCSANWMWAAKLAGEGAAMYEACEAMATFMGPIGVSVDGGKDSLSMAARVADGETVKAPGALVITTYACCTDIGAVVTPDLKAADSSLYLIDLSTGRRRVGGTALAQVYSQLGDTPPDLTDAPLLSRAFGALQTLVKARGLLAGHDVSDGGILTAALEMAFAGDKGLVLDLPAAAEADGGTTELGLVAAAFAEEIGLLVEVGAAQRGALEAAMSAADVPCCLIGSTTFAKTVQVSIGGAKVLDGPLATYRGMWEETSFQLERLQTLPACAAEEEASLSTRSPPAWQLSYTPAPTAAAALAAPTKPKVAVLRQEGSNGDREMAAALHAAGLEPWDVSMADLAAGAVELSAFRGIVFVGGFSYADVMDSAKGWAGALKFNAKLSAQLQAFRDRSDTWSLGICNGCQLMALLGWVPSAAGAAPLSDLEQPRFVHNRSGRFESRFSSVTILESPAVLLHGMEGSSLGVWVAHGEGRAHFPSSKVYDHVMAKGLAPVRYVDDANKITGAYPFNPNGSPDGIAALCSEDGRHLAMMPHPERCYLAWQVPWQPEGWAKHEAGPWLRLFQNAAAFCKAH